MKGNCEREPEHTSFEIDTSFGAGRGRPLPTNEFSYRKPLSGRAAPRSLPRAVQACCPPLTPTLSGHPTVTSPSQHTAQIPKPQAKELQKATAAPRYFVMAVQARCPPPTPTLSGHLKVTSPSQHTAQIPKPQAKELQRATAAPRHLVMAVQARCPPPTPAPSGQPKLSSPSQPRRPPSHAVDAAREAAATPADSKRNCVAVPTRHATKAPLRTVRAPSGTAGIVSPSEHGLNLWGHSLSPTRRQDPSSDGDELSNEDEDEDDEPSIPRKDSLRRTSPTPAASTAPPAAEGSPPFPTFSRLLEIRGLPEKITAEYIYDAVSSFTAVDNVDIFHAGNGAGGACGRITFAEPCPIAWICKCVERNFSFEGEPVVFACPGSESDAPSTTAGAPEKLLPGP